MESQELAEQAKQIANDVRLANESQLNTFINGPIGVASLATAVEVLAGAVVALSGEVAATRER